MAYATSTYLAIAAIAAAGVSAYGSYQSGQTQKAMSDYNAKLAENEAIAKEQAATAEAQRMRTEKEKVLARQRAAYAKSGAVITEGTPLLTMAEQAGLMELDIMNMQRTGAMSAQASKSQAALDRFSGQSAATAANWQAGSTLLSSAGSIGSSAASSNQG